MDWAAGSLENGFGGQSGEQGGWHPQQGEKLQHGSPPAPAPPSLLESISGEYALVISGHSLVRGGEGRWGASYVLGEVVVNAWRMGPYAW